MESDSITSQANGSQPDKPQRRATLANIHTTSTTTKQVNEKGWPKADTLGTVNTSSDPSVNRRPSLPVLTRSAGLSLHVPKELSIPEELSPSIVSPLTSFFQATQRSTPVTMTNPFAKLSDFVNSYIVLQEFCKELAAVILVRHMTHHNEIGYLRALEQREQIDNIGSPDASTNHDWFIDHRLLDDENAAYRKKKMEKWKNRFSAVSTLAEWKSIQGSDMMDEAIAARIKSKAGGMAAALT
jgi:hypothetical protein